MSTSNSTGVLYAPRGGQFIHRGFLSSDLVTQGCRDLFSSLLHCLTEALPLRGGPNAWKHGHAKKGPYLLHVHCRECFLLLVIYLLGS